MRLKYVQRSAVCYVRSFAPGYQTSPVSLSQSLPHNESTETLILDI